MHSVFPTKCQSPAPWRAFFPTLIADPLRMDTACLETCVKSTDKHGLYEVQGTAAVRLSILERETSVFMTNGYSRCQPLVVVASASGCSTPSSCSQSKFRADEPCWDVPGR